MTRASLLLIAVTTVGCKSKPKEQPAPPPPPQPVVADAAAAMDAPAPDASDTSDAGAFDPGELQGPESVYYDEGRDMYIVANVSGEPTAADDNGFLVNVNPDGSNERANANFKWIDGSADDIKLDAPKGMAISGDTLYVADISVVRRFDAKTGKQKDDVAIPGGQFVNDITPDGAGGVFVSDTGTGGDMKPKGGDGIYRVAKDGKLSTVIKNKDLGNPNGIWFDGTKLWVVTFGTGEIYDVDPEGAKGKGKGKAQKLPAGQLDGIVGGLDGGDFAVSSWECKCVYRGKPGGEWTPIVKDVESAADLGYDSKRKRLIIPGLTTNKLTVHQL